MVFLKSRLDPSTKRRIARGIVKSFTILVFVTRDEYL
jgi:hypothetical protein